MTAELAAQPQLDARRVGDGPFDEARQIAALVLMPRLLESLGFDVHERTRRCACILHGGHNESAFSWTETGLWKCHSCGAGGDRIALVRAVRRCSFSEAIGFLAGLAGVDYRARRFPAEEIQRARQRREPAARGAWVVHDEIIHLRGYYGDGLRRSERLQAYLGGRGGCAMWDVLARLASVSTFFLSAFTHINRLDIGGLVRFVLLTPVERRAAIVGEGESKNAISAQTDRSRIAS